METYASIPKAFCIRVPGKCDIGDGLGKKVAVDGALRVAL
jgi:hypothetical protein